MGESAGSGIVLESSHMCLVVQPTVATPHLAARISCRQYQAAPVLVKVLHVAGQPGVRRWIGRRLG